jgi:hypothetical protein
MNLIDRSLEWLGRRIVGTVICAADPAKTPIHTDPDRLARIMRPGDVLLVDGCDKVSAAIRYLTQSSWSHAALFVGDIKGTADEAGRPHCLVEVTLASGCATAPLSTYRHYATRICRPVNLVEADRQRLVRFMMDRIGITYDTRNILDLARYLLPTPPIPARWRRQMLAFGSGEPTRAICSSLIAEAFQDIGYPILPQIERRGGGEIALANGYTEDEIFHIRHHSLFTPRDFDVSPFFEIVKPTLVEGFNYKGVAWASDQAGPRVADPKPADRAMATTRALRSADG